MNKTTNFFKAGSRVLLLCLLPALFLQACTSKQETVTQADYQRAESFLAGNTSSKVHNQVSGFMWGENDHLVYLFSGKEGREFLLADPLSGAIEPAFDHGRLAETLSELTSETVDPADLPFRSFRYTDQGIAFTIRNNDYVCSLDDYICESKRFESPVGRGNEAVSPDGKKAVYIKDHNLWVRDLESGRETQLTFDGQEDYGYGTNNAGWSRRARPVVLWSPDSRSIATFQHDARGTKDMVLVSTNVGHPTLHQWKYPLPGDSLIFRIERVVVHLEPRPRVVRLQMEPDMHRSALTDHIADRAGNLLDAQWSEDGRQFFFLSSSRDHKEAWLRTADAQSGRVREVLYEALPTFFESGYNMRANWHVLPESNEFIWFSQRDNWGHLYLYAHDTGQIKHQITQGDYNVINILHIDKENRQIFFIGNCREEGNPYYEYLYRIDMDGGNLTLLSPEPAHHQVNLSPSGEFFTQVYSTPDTPPVAQIRSTQGDVVMELSSVDISDLLDMGWVAPIEFSVKARDGETDLWGIMYKPTNFKRNRSYPVLCYIYPGPQSGSVGSRAFRASRSDKQALAELGFIVVEVDAMGTPGRSKSFHDAYYGNMGDNGLPDQITMIEQLAQRHSYMDISRVGIFGHSGGGFASTRAVLEYPDFFKVAVSSAGNHDNRNYTDDWAEKWQGLLETYEDEEGQVTTNYDNQANQLLAENLKGKLLITHGTLDSNVPPCGTLLVVNALIAANKDFDMIMFPNRGHGYSAEPYMMRRRWDYFVEHLKEVSPPKEFEFGRQ